MNELKPCPFCGEKKHIFVRERHKQDNLGRTEFRFEVYCGMCSAIGGMRTTRDAAIKSWNGGDYRAQRGKGFWILEREPDGKPYCFHCSVCDSDFHRISNTRIVPFCPDCGAEMDIRRPFYKEAIDVFGKE